MQKAIKKVQSLTYNQEYNISTFQTLHKIKRFYKDVDIKEYSNPKVPHLKYKIELDGRTVKTPSKNELAVPTFEMAVALYGEFAIQKDFMTPATMPLYSLSRTAVDIEFDPRIRGHLKSSLIDHLETDTIWYRDEEEPELFDLQVQHLDPLAAYINKRLNIHMKMQHSLGSNILSGQDKQRLEEYFETFNNWKFLSLEYATSTLKSTSLAVALMDDKVDIEMAVDLSMLEENYQQSHFGKIEEFHDVNETTSLMMVSAAKNFYNFSH